MSNPTAQKTTIENVSLEIHGYNLNDLKRVLGVLHDLHITLHIIGVHGVTHVYVYVTHIYIHIIIYKRVHIHLHVCILVYV